MQPPQFPPNEPDADRTMVVPGPARRPPPQPGQQTPPAPAPAPAGPYYGPPPQSWAQPPQGPQAYQQPQPQHVQGQYAQPPQYAQQPQYAQPPQQPQYREPQYAQPQQYGPPGHPAPEAQVTQGSSHSRRNVIVGTAVAVVAAAGGYAAYVEYGPSSKKTAEPATGGSNPPVPAYGATTTAGAPATTGAPAAAKVLANVADIPENGGIVLTDQKIVLTRATGDQVHAFTAVCTHQGCLVGTISGGTIQCPCHGSAFDATTGAVVNGPAAQPLAAVPVSVVNGQVQEK